MTGGYLQTRDLKEDSHAGDARSKFVPTVQVAQSHNVTFKFKRPKKM